MALPRIVAAKHATGVFVVNKGRKGELSEDAREHVGGGAISDDGECSLA
jgi:hypothetical protein